MMTTDQPLRIAVLDDHPIVAEGIVSAVARRAGSVTLVGTASTWDAFVHDILEAGARPDIALVDAHVNDGSYHAEVIKTLTKLGIRCLLFTSDPRPVIVRDALKAGACGLILKSEPVDVVVDTIEQLRTQPVASSSTLAHSIVTDAQMAPHLAPRELETMRLLSTGLTRAAVARRMSGADGDSLTPGTVNTYVNRVVGKYRQVDVHSSSTMELLARLRRDGHIVEEPH